jgi:hypothetical protein
MSLFMAPPRDSYVTIITWVMPATQTNYHLSLRPQ